MTVTFCGHAEIAYSDDVRSWLIDTVEGVQRGSVCESISRGLANLKKFLKDF